MPRRNDIAKVLIIGSGPIVIGQSAEFDYSGAQACKALKSEGYEVVLANSNPATIMTDPEMADRTYIEPLTRTYLEEIIRIETEMLARQRQRPASLRCCPRLAAKPRSTLQSNWLTAACSKSMACSSSARSLAQSRKPKTACCSKTR